MSTPTRDLLDDRSYSSASTYSFASPPPPEYGNEPYEEPSRALVVHTNPSSELWSYDQVNTTLGFPNNSNTSNTLEKNMPIAPDIDKLKKKRRRRTAAAGVVGGVVGLATLGPAGMVVGGVGAAMVTKSAGKRKERRKTRKYQNALAAGNATNEMGVVPAENAVLA